MYVCMHVCMYVCMCNLCAHLSQHDFLVCALPFILPVVEALGARAQSSLSFLIGGSRCSLGHFHFSAHFERRWTVPNPPKVGKPVAQHL